MEYNLLILLELLIFILKQAVKMKVVVRISMTLRNIVCYESVNLLLLGKSSLRK